MTLPEMLSYEQAAALPCPALTAWQALEKIPTKSGKHLLISGAGGSVGQYLLQFAVQRGFKVSILSHERHWQKLRSLGAVECLDENQIATNKALLASFFAVIDTRSAESASALAALLSANGHLVAIQDRPKQWPSVPFSQSWSMHEVALGALHRYGNDADWLELTQAGELIMRNAIYGTLKIDEIITADFDSLPQQLSALKNRTFSGKLIIKI